MKHGPGVLIKRLLGEQRFPPEIHEWGLIFSQVTEKPVQTCCDRHYKIMHKFVSAN